MTAGAELLLEVDGLVKRYERPPAPPTVDGVSFTLRRGETLGLVGESGSGKSTTAMCLLQLVRPDAGRVTFEGCDLVRASRRELRAARRRLGVVFQDPHSSLDPRLSIEDAVAEPLRIQQIGSAQERRRRAQAMLERVGIDPARGHQRPHQLSGGQRQRVGIARAFVGMPQLVVCDEAVSALDVSIQAQILNLLKDLQQEHGTSYLFISHDLAVVRNVSDWVAVMQDGRIVEHAEADELFERPTHAYTRKLLAAIPTIEGPVPAPRSATHAC